MIKFRYLISKRKKAMSENFRKKISGKGTYPRRIFSVMYYPVYFLLFLWLETHLPLHFLTVHLTADDWIPFCPPFVVFYLFWYVYNAAGYLLLFSEKNPMDFYRMSTMICLIMAVFLICSFAIPNGQDLRPNLPAEKNIFERLLAAVWKADPPRNLFPSIHVSNTLLLAIGIDRSAKRRKKPLLRILSGLLAVLIVASTMLIKQHSVFDVALAFACVAAGYPFFFGRHCAVTDRRIMRYDPAAKPYPAKKQKNAV